MADQFVRLQCVVGTPQKRTIVAAATCNDVFVNRIRSDAVDRVRVSAKRRTGVETHWFDVLDLALTVIVVVVIVVVAAAVIVIVVGGLVATTSSCVTTDLVIVILVVIHVAIIIIIVVVFRRRSIVRTVGRHQLALELVGIEKLAHVIVVVVVVVVVVELLGVLLVCVAH